MMRIFAGIVAAVMAGSAQAGTLGNFECIPLKDAGSLIVAAGKIKINNIAFREKDDPIFNADGLRVFEASYSVQNDGAGPYHMSAQFAIFGPEGKLLAALEASPGADYLSANSSVMAKGEVYVVPGSMQTAETVCYNFVGKSAPALPG